MTTLKDKIKDEIFEFYGKHDFNDADFYDREIKYQELTDCICNIIIEHFNKQLT